MTIRVVLVDDQELTRAGLRMLLESSDVVNIVGEASDGREALDLLDDVATDVVLMDIRMPVLDGVEATRELVARGGSPVLILTTFDLDEYVLDALHAGASGFLVKDTPLEELISAIQHLHHGDAVVAPTATRRLLARFSQLPAVPTHVEMRLTERENETLVLVARGLSNAEIAQQFVISEGTVKTHVSRILTKLGLRDRVQAVVYAYERGLVRPEG